MLQIVTALDIRTAGVFKTIATAKQFNKKVGEHLHLHQVRTTLNWQEFKTAYFLEGCEGAYLEKCCGPGNVKLDLISPPFFAIQTVSGPVHEKVIIHNIFNRYEQNQTWDQKSILNTKMLMSPAEIEKEALHPFRTVMVRNFGEVNAENISAFKNSVELSFRTKNIS